MIKWTEKAVEAAIKGWFGIWASDEERMLNALNKASEAQGIKKPDVVDMTMLLAWENGWDAALAECQKIAESTVDEYNRQEEYCKGICDASEGIAKEIKEMRNESAWRERDTASK